MRLSHFGSCVSRIWVIYGLSLRMLWAFPQDAMGFPSGCYGRREEFRQVARLPADGIRRDARGEVGEVAKEGELKQGSLDLGKPV